MKSIIYSFLLLSTTLSLFPFAAFSSSFTSDNPIVLPTTFEDNGMPVPVLPEVLDINGEPLLIGQEYHILSAVRGAGGGGVYLAKIGNTKCPNAVLQHGRDTQQGMPVKFLRSFPSPPPFNIVRETNEVEIMFSIPSTPRCDNGTYWMVDNPDATARGLRFVVTSAVKISPNILFKIEKLSETSSIYKLRHCPSRSICPTCPCSDVGVTIHFGSRRLALTNQPFMVVFKKV